MLKVAQRDALDPASLGQAVVARVGHFDFTGCVGTVAQQDNAVVAPDRFGAGVVQAGASAVAHGKERADTAAAQILI